MSHSLSLSRTQRSASLNPKSRSTRPASERRSLVGPSRGSLEWLFLHMELQLESCCGVKYCIRTYWGVLQMKKMTTYFGKYEGACYGGNIMQTPDSNPKYNCNFAKPMCRGKSSRHYSECIIIIIIIATLLHQDLCNHLSILATLNP